MTNIVRLQNWVDVEYFKLCKVKISTCTKIMQILRCCVSVSSLFRITETDGGGLQPKGPGVVGCGWQEHILDGQVFRYSANLVLCVRTLQEIKQNAPSVNRYCRWSLKWEGQHYLTGCFTALWNVRQSITCITNLICNSNGWRWHSGTIGKHKVDVWRGVAMVLDDLCCCWTQHAQEV